MIIIIYFSNFSDTFFNYLVKTKTTKTSRDELILENDLLQGKIDSLLQLSNRIQPVKIDTVVRLDDSSRVYEEIIRLRITLSSMSDSIKKNSESYLALRQSLNPINPDEVLTIARIMDEVKKLNERQNNFEKRVEDNLRSVSQNVLYRAESSDKTTNIILLVLVPIIINFLYTVWKDYKKDKNFPQKQSLKDD